LVATVAGVHRKQAEFELGAKRFSGSITVPDRNALKATWCDCY
jgi:hypothetical protein